MNIQKGNGTGKRPVIEKFRPAEFAEDMKGEIVREVWWLGGMFWADPFERSMFETFRDAVFKELDAAANAMLVDGATEQSCRTIYREMYGTFACLLGKWGAARERFEQRLKTIDDYLAKRDERPKPEPTKPEQSKTSGSDYDFDPPDDDDDDNRILNRIWSPPHDFWNYQPTETLREGMLPEFLEPIVFEYAERTGLDADALGLSMLTVLSSAMPTGLRVAENTDPDNTFIQALRLYTAIVGKAGKGKSPITEVVMRAPERRDEKLLKQFDEEWANYESHTKEEQKELDKPICRLAILPGDHSTESVQRDFSENSEGLLGFWDELVGFFGSKSRYSNKSGGGEQVARGFWLSAYDSRRFKQSRISRARINCIPSLSILGGIQQKVIKNLAEETDTNDGLIQRFCISILPDTPVVKHKGEYDVKYPTTLFDERYHALFSQMPLRLTGATFHLDAKATLVKDKLFEWADEKAAYYDESNPALSAHLLKFKGLFLRFAGIYHVIEHYADKHARKIDHETASRVYKYLTGPRYSNAQAFYSMLQENDENNDMRNIAEFIIAYKLERVSARQIQQGSHRMRNISTRDIAHTTGNLVSLGWLHHIDGKRRDTFNWIVNPDVHFLFQTRASIVREKLAKRQETFNDIIKGLPKGVANVVQAKLNQNNKILRVRHHDDDDEETEE